MEKIYDAYVIVPLRKQMCFRDSYLSKDALEHMKEWNVSAEVERDTHDDISAKKCRSIDTVTESDTVIPIRITMDVTGEDFSDDWIVASPIIELDFNPINRWWPKDWFIDENGQPYDNIRINYKENVVLNLKYIKVRQEIINESFIDVITPTDELLDTNDDELLKMNVEEGDKIMAFNKNKNKNNIEIEGQIEEPVIEVPAGSEPVAEIENSAAPTSESESSEDEKEKVHLDLNNVEIIDVDLKARVKSKKKNIRRVLKGTAITVGVSAIAVGAFFGIKAIVAAKRGDGDVAATVAE